MIVLTPVALFCSVVFLGYGLWEVKFIIRHKHRQGETKRPTNVIRLLNFMKALLVVILTLYRCSVDVVWLFKALGRFIWNRDIENKSTWNKCCGYQWCIINIISTVKMKLPGSGGGRQTVYDSSASLSLPTLHRTPPPLPPSGSNPGHCQKLTNPKLMYWGRGGRSWGLLQSFSCFLYLFITV